MRAEKNEKALLRRRRLKVKSMHTKIIFSYNKMKLLKNHKNLQYLHQQLKSQLASAAKVNKEA